MDKCVKCQQESELAELGLCGECYSGRHLPPPGKRTALWGTKCPCFPQHLCSWARETDSKAKDLLCTTTHGCSYCKHRIYSLDINDTGSILCASCVSYIANFDQSSEYYDLALLMANSDAQAQGLIVVYDENNLPPLCDIVEEYKPDQVLKSQDEIVDDHRIGDDNEKEKDFNGVSIIRDGYIPPDEDQQLSFDSSEQDGIYAELFYQQGVLPLNDGNRLPTPFNCGNFGLVVTTSINDSIRTFSPCVDEKRREKQEG